MATWDRLSPSAYVKERDAAVREQMRDSVAPFSPYWRQRLSALGLTGSAITNVAALDLLPAVAERDVSPDGDPAGMAALVLQASQSGFALHAQGPTLRKALTLRLTRPSSYRRVVASDTRPTSFVWSGLGFRYPLASTRGDLDLVARAGARLWQVLGLTDADALLSAVPVAATTEHVALEYAALASGSPALFPGDEPEAVLAAARLAPPTVVAAPSAAAADVLDDLASSDADLSGLRTLLLVGGPSADQRAAAQEALAAAAPAALALAVHAPAGARVLWGECRASGGATGLHTYPDLDVVGLVDPDTAAPAHAVGGEVVLTQLGFRGTALVRWRTGDLAGAVDETPCPSCGRRVARVTGELRAGALVRRLGDRAVDLRAVAGALAGRADVTDWRAVVGRRARGHRDQLVVHVVSDPHAADVPAGVAADVESAAGVVPDQVVNTTADKLAALDALDAEPLTARILVTP